VKNHIKFKFNNNSCYLNSILHMLSFIPEFIDLLYFKYYSYKIIDDNNIYCVYNNNDFYEFKKYIKIKDNEYSLGEILYKYIVNYNDLINYKNYIEYLKLETLNSYINNNNILDYNNISEDVNKYNY